MKGIIMKYLVTFAYANNVEVLKYISNNKSDESQPITEYIDKIQFHSIIVEKNENKTLSDLIEETKMSFYNTKIESENRYWSREQTWYNIEWIKCIGINPIMNDDVEEAIKQHCLN